MRRSEPVYRSDLDLFVQREALTTVIQKGSGGSRSQKSEAPLIVPALPYTPISADLFSLWLAERVGVAGENLETRWFR